MLRAFLFILALAAGTPALAQDDANFRFGGDAYMAGRIVTLSGDPVQDLFAAGDSVTAGADIGGTAHMAGRYVTLEAPVSGNLYAAGMSIAVDAPVAGNVSAFGDGITVTEPVSGNVRATGARVEISGPVGGSALLAGGRVTLDAEVTGDVLIASPEIVWGDGARIDGTLEIYAEEPDSVEIPQGIVSPENVTLHELSQYERAPDRPYRRTRPTFWENLQGFVGGVLVVGLLTTLLAVLAPSWVARLREATLARPARTLWIGALGLSAVFGSTVLLLMTGLGIVIVPFAVLAGVLLGIAGYLIGTYVVGVFALTLAGRGAPDSTGERAIAAFGGAQILALIGLIPFLGWLAVLLVGIAGAGALVVRWFAPGFNVEG